MKFIDLFAGIGGFRYGLESVNREKNRRSQKTQKDGNSKRHKKLKETDTKGGRLGKYSNNGGRKKLFTCVYSNEWDKYASQIYKKHYGEIDTRDITKVKEIPDHDLLCAGFPCQSFSIAGKRLGFDDTRGTLFFEIARIAKHKRPRYLLLENVKGLLSHDKGKTFSTILGVLSDLGYRVEWQVLNSKHFGVPQNRERVFIIGHLGGFRGRKVFPLAQSSEGNLAYSAGVISQREKWLKGEKHLSREFSQGQRIYSDKGISQTLAGNAGGQGGKTGLYMIDPLHMRREGKPRIYKDISSTLNKRDYKEPKIIGGGTRVRRLTPTECERLQGFPDGWTEGISDTQRYKCLGNAVTTNVITAIGKKLL